MNKTIVFCCNSSFGVANFRGGVVRELVRRGNRVIVIAPRDGYEDSFAALGAEFVAWDVSGESAHPLREARALWQLIRFYRRHGPDAVFHFTIKPVIYGAIAAKLARVPSISVVTGLGYAFLNTGIVARLSRWLYGMTLHWAREVWFLNHHDIAEFERLGLIAPGVGVVLPGEGVDTDHFAPRPSAPRATGEFIFLMAARLLVDKGVHEYIAAAREVRARYPLARFQLLGPAEASNPTAISRDEVQAWEDESVIEYLGSTRDVRPFLAAADSVVLPSYREGLSRVLLEAASMGRPVIASDVPGCAEVVVDGASGLLCRVRDAGDLAAKMSRMMELSTQKRESMGHYARDHVQQNFDERIIVRRYLQTLERMHPV